MSFDFAHTQLILNPRMPEKSCEDFERAWQQVILPQLQLKNEKYFGIVSSGSSGDPLGRLFVLSREAIFSSAQAVNQWFDCSREDIWLKVLPTFHVGGIGILARAQLSGAKIYESKMNRWNARNFYEELVVSRATLISLVATQLFDLVEEELKAPEFLRVVILGGGPLHADLRERAISLGWPVYPSYGLTECCSQVATARFCDQNDDSNNDKNDVKLFPLSHVKLRIGEGGIIEIQSPALFTGHLSFSKTELLDHNTEQVNESKLNARFSEFASGSWFQTSDCGSLEFDGSLKVLGRSSDFVKIAGEGVIVSRLEERLLKIKMLLALKGDVAILAQPDARLGAKIILLTNLETDDSENLVKKFNESVLPFERIREFHRLKEIPRSPLGKLLRESAFSAIQN